MSARPVTAPTPPRVAAPAPAPPRRRRSGRLLVGVLTACWLLVVVAPVSAATAPPTPHEHTRAAAPAGAGALAQDVETGDEDGGDAEDPTDDATDQADDPDDGDRETVAGLVAIVLLAVTIGAHALYRDQR